MYPNDLIQYYNIKYGYKIPFKYSYRMLKNMIDCNTILKKAKGRNLIAKSHELPVVWPIRYEFEGKEDQTFVWEDFVVEAHEYFIQHPEEKPSNNRKKI
jgi:hypothetical protein